MGIIDGGFGANVVAGFVVLLDGVASEPVFDAGVIVVESPEGFGFCFPVGTAAKNPGNALGQSEALEFIQKPFKETGVFVAR